MLSAAAATAIAALFHPLPASAAPAVPAPPVAPVIPDVGSRPTPVGTFQMPGQTATTPVTTTPVTLPGISLSPILQEQEKRQNEINALGDQLIKLRDDRDLARQQADDATAKLTTAQAALTQAQHDAADAAAAAVRDQAALPPGTLGSGLADLDALSRMQRGETASEEAANRQLALIQDTQTIAWAEQTTASARYSDLAQQWDKLNTTISGKQKSFDKWRADHGDELSAAEATANAEDLRLGQSYQDGTNSGRGADPKAIAALTIALKQIGDPYVWSEEGPDQFDCSGLMFYAYHSKAAGNFPLARVSRDQYWQLRNKVVDRYSLLPGDLLFFSSSNSWTGIHHVAMYAGDGMMVEAPRTGLDVRLTPVRWTRLFGATRVYGSVDHPTSGPDLNNLPKPGNDDGSDPTKPTKPKPSGDPKPGGGSTPPGGGGSTPPGGGGSTPPGGGGSTPPGGGGSTPPGGGGSTPPGGGGSTPPGGGGSTPPAGGGETTPPSGGGEETTPPSGGGQETDPPKTDPPANEEPKPDPTKDEPKTDEPSTPTSEESKSAPESSSSSN
ncbi:NlpC/P60 family protein [Actinoplanes sp. NPDC049265]|uniref:C40 family peptidase n=1 Tax=Actinoplanes sp. NPDC049265 TaxID=3363902 RepID=UPI003712E2C2